MLHEDFNGTIDKWSSLDFTAIVVDQSENRNDIYLATSASPPHARLYLCRAPNAEMAETLSLRFRGWLSTYRKNS